jgi:hypothetical protein
MLIQDMSTGNWIEVDYTVSTCDRCHKVHSVKNLVFAPKNEEDMKRTIYCKQCCDKLAVQYDRTH